MVAPEHLGAKNIAALLAQEQAFHAGAVRRAQNGSHIARVLHTIQGHQAFAQMGNGAHAHHRRNTLWCFGVAHCRQDMCRQQRGLSLGQ